MSGLSAKRQDIVDCIRHFLEDRGYPPTVRDIQSACGISSTSVVDYHLRVLEREGYIRRHPEVSRGIELADNSPRSLMRVPLVGQIAAGNPLPVLTPDTWDITAGAETISITRDLVRGLDGIYALVVKGWSMVDAMIGDGDIVLMQNVNTVESGEMAAVWLKEEKEVTLKKVYVEAGYVRLQPANTEMVPIYASPGNIEIQGRVVGVIRQLVRD